ncbi:MAG: outer membrane protein [Hyphomicrobiaceae bacterium]
MRSFVKSALLSSVALVGVSLWTPVQAADLGGARPVRPPPDFAPPLERPYNYDRWAGFYLGGTLGYGWGEGQSRGQLGNFTYEQSGMLGTIFAGYNWQAGSTVYGLEADIGTGGLSSSRSTAGGNLETELNAMGSVRGRLGFLATPSLLLYGTAGLAWANMDFNVSGGQSRSETFLGYQVGLGGEMMISSNVTLRLEYLYTDLGNERVIHNGQTNNYDPDFSQVRAGVSFKF